MPGQIAYNLRFAFIKQPFADLTRQVWDISRQLSASLNPLAAFSLSAGVDQAALRGVDQAAARLRLGAGRAGPAGGRARWRGGAGPLPVPSAAAGWRRSLGAGRRRCGGERGAAGGRPSCGGGRHFAGFVAPAASQPLLGAARGRGNAALAAWGCGTGLGRADSPQGRLCSSSS